MLWPRGIRFMLCCRASEFIGCVFLGGHAAVDSGTVEDHCNRSWGVGFLSNGWTSSGKVNVTSGKVLCYIPDFTQNNSLYFWNERRNNKRVRKRDRSYALCWQGFEWMIRLYWSCRFCGRYNCGDWSFRTAIFLPLGNALQPQKWTELAMFEFRFEYELLTLLQLEDRAESISTDVWDPNQRDYR